jgi:hypothetical protein
MSEKCYELYLYYESGEFIKKEIEEITKEYSDYYNCEYGFSNQGRFIFIQCKESEIIKVKKQLLDIKIKEYKEDRDDLNAKIDLLMELWKSTNVPLES